MRTPSAIAIAASLGFGIVTVLCMVAGYSVSPALVWNNATIVLMAMLILVALPYFFQREALLEMSADHTPTVAEIQVIDLFGIVFVLIAIILGWFSRDDLLRSSLGHTAFLFIAACSPFAYLYIRTRRALTKSVVPEIERTFARRILLPALFSCVMPFVYGWELGSSDSNHWLVIITAVVLVAWDAKSSSQSSIMSQLTFIVIFVLGATLLQIVDQFGKVLIFGALMTFAMGVTEVCKRVYLTDQSKIQVHTNETTDFYLAGANWSSIVFPLGLLFLPLLILDFPTWPVCVATFFLMSNWGLRTADRKKSKSAYYSSMLIGYSVPFLIIMGSLLHTRPSILRIDLTAVFISVIPIIIAIFAVSHTQLAVKRFLRDLFKIDMFLDSRYCKSFLWACLVICVTLVTIVSMAFVSIYDDKTYAYKGTDIGVFIFLIALFLFAYYPDNSDSSNGTICTNALPDAQELDRNILGYILVTSRCSVSFISAVPILIAFVVAAYPLVTGVLLSLSIALVTMAGFIFNDVFDYEKDKKAQFDRPIAKDLLSRGMAMQFAIAFCSVAAILVVSFGSFGSSLVIAATIFGVFIYSFFSRYAPTLKGMFTAVLCVAPLLLVSTELGVPISPVVFACLLLFIFGRELLMDTYEVDTDCRSGVKTLAYYLGQRSSKVLSWIIMLSSYGAFIYLVNGLTAVLFAIGMVTLVMSLVISRRSAMAAINYTRVPLLLGALGVGVNAAIL